MSFRYIDPNITDPVQHPPYTAQYNEPYYIELRDAFRLFDQDNDGVISMTELVKVLKHLRKWDYIAEVRMREDIEEGDGEDGDEENGEDADETATQSEKPQTADSAQQEGSSAEQPPLEERIEIPDPTDQEIRDVVKYMTGRLGIMDHITFHEFCQLMQKQLEETDIEEQFRETFRVVDKDRDGFISMAELREALVEFTGEENISQDELTKFMKEVDHDGDCQLSYEDFVKLFISMAEAQ